MKRALLAAAIAGLSWNVLAQDKPAAEVGYGNAVMPETLSGLGDAERSDLAHFLAHFRR